MAGRRHFHVALLMTAVLSTAMAPVRAATDTPAPTVTFQPVPFAALPGWSSDDHAEAFGAFLRSCDRLLQRPALDHSGPAPLIDVCRQARVRAERGQVRRGEARLYFEHFFVPYRVIHGGAPGLLTGYYEPVLDGSRVRTSRFHVPLYRRPPDLENVVAETQRGAPGIGFTHMRRTAQGLTPYPTRAEIEAGALAGQSLELIWLADPVDAFFLQIQGSGRIRFPDGTAASITYDGKNGHPYSSVGRYLIDQRVIGAASMTLDRLGQYLRADVKRGREVMQHNASFVFFREFASAPAPERTAKLSPAEADRALGALGIGLTPGRSLAVDASVHTLGSPVYVVAPTLRHASPNIRPRRPFQRLMVAQDVGSAIRGPERGDIYFGSGDAAGALAGVTKHRGQFFVLQPRAPRPSPGVPK